VIGDDIAPVVLAGIEHRQQYLAETPHDGQRLQCLGRQGGDTEDHYPPGQSRRALISADHLLDKLRMDTGAPVPPRLATAIPRHPPAPPARARPASRTPPPAAACPLWPDLCDPAPVPSRSASRPDTPDTGRTDPPGAGPAGSACDNPHHRRGTAAAEQMMAATAGPATAASDARSAAPCPAGRSRALPPVRARCGRHPRENAPAAAHPAPRQRRSHPAPDPPPAPSAATGRCRCSAPASPRSPAAPAG